MIHEILHIIGMCGDSFSHIDLIDIILSLYNNGGTINRFWIKFYFGI